MFFVSTARRQSKQLYLETKEEEVEEEGREEGEKNEFWYLRRQSTEHGQFSRDQRRKRHCQTKEYPKDSQIYFHLSVHLHASP